MSSTTVSKISENGLRSQVPLANAISSLQQRQLRLVSATAGDHLAILHLLQGIFHQPSDSEFHSQNEQPLYEPTDRLLVKQDSRVVSHARLEKREMHFGPLVLPVGYLSELATAPEFRGQGCAGAVLQAAEQQMRSEGAVLGILRARDPQFYLRRGWAVCGRHCYSTAGPREILSHISATATSRVHMLAPLEEPLNIRLWRHVELAALVRLYAENTRGAFGAWRRNEEYWRWLISRRSYERIYVAIEGPDKFDLDESISPIVGYVATKEGRLIEMMTSPQHPQAAVQLLARACGDAIERDYHRVRVDAPPDNPLHRLVELAGGEHRYREVENGEVLMVKLFDPPALMRQMLPQLNQRAKAAAVSRPFELGLILNQKKYCLSLRSRSVKLIADKIPRSYLTLGMTELTQLLLGHLDIPAAIEAGRLQSSTRIAVETASALFPHLPLWIPPLDDLSAQ